MTTNDNTSPRAGLDLDALTKRARRVYPKRGWDGGEAERALPVVTEDVPALVAEVIRLRALRDDLADAFDGLVMKVWRATGETHEPPSDVAALLARVAQLRAVRDVAVTSNARREGAEAMREACARHCAHRAEVLDARGADHCDPDDPDTAEDYGRFCEAHELAAALRALPLPGGEP